MGIICIHESLALKVYLLSILTIAILCIMITYSTALRIIMMITIVINTIYGEVDVGEICLYVYIYRVACKTLRKSTDCSEVFK